MLIRLFRHPEIKKVPIWRNSGKYRKKMEKRRSLQKEISPKRSKDETIIFSVIKRMIGENVRSVRDNAQKNELRFQADTVNRIANLAYSFIIGFLHSPLLSYGGLNFNDEKLQSLIKKIK